MSRYTAVPTSEAGASSNKHHRVAPEDEEERADLVGSTAGGDAPGGPRFSCEETRDAVVRRAEALRSAGWIRIACIASIVLLASFGLYQAGVVESAARAAEGAEEDDPESSELSDMLTDIFDNLHETNGRKKNYTKPPLGVSKVMRVRGEDRSDRDPDPDNCTVPIDLTRLTPYERLERDANCGSGYKYTPSTRNKPVKVFLYGENFGRMLSLSGCPGVSTPGECPTTPTCTFHRTTYASQLVHADVVVALNMDAEALVSALGHGRNRKKNLTPPYRVLYWREASWAAPSKPTQLNDFDFEMGIHYDSGVVNPSYLRRPSVLLRSNFLHVENIPFYQRTNFGISVISDCDAHSQRQIYLNHLADYLGHDRVHQYGRCGNRDLPPAPIQNAAAIISSYKFYFSFENNIQAGYVTEKLFTILNLNILPVYYGTPHAPNITVVPSYVRVSDFRTPKELALYLLYLDANPEEYAKYNSWRSMKEPFAEDYLKKVAEQVPGPAEVMPYHAKGMWLRTPRRVACCRLCDLEFVKQTAMKRDLESAYVEPRWEPPRIDNKFFAGTMLGPRPGPGARLAPSSKQRKTNDTAT